jgi:spore maturation protein CgeB
MSDRGWRIAFFGSSLVSAYWNGAATYYRGIVRALAERGHQVTFYEPDAYDRQKHRDLPDPPWARVVVYPGEGEAGVAAAVAEASDADLIVKASGVGVFDAWLERAVLEMPHRGAVLFWDVDAAATLDRVQSDPDDPFRPLIPRYDLILTYGGGEPVVSAYARLGARRCVPIYNALDPETHHPVLADPRYVCDLAFLGNCLPDREARVEQFFLSAARRLPDAFFILGGSGWDQRALPANVAAVGHVFTKDHNAFNVSPRAVLNISRDSMARYGFSPATRVFEAAGAGSCLITDAWDGIEMFLEPDSEVLVARDGDEVTEHLRALGPARAAAIGMLARRRILAEHTYAHRARQLEETLRDAGLDARRGAA